ncbi:hypothetical protein scyTo_0023671, partial [Scyliorhinus torazame]|nr:hypothetical protein [Scyliorhinus torazame]
RGGEAEGGPPPAQPLPPPALPAEAPRDATRALLAHIGFELIAQYNEGRQCVQTQAARLGLAGRLRCDGCSKLFSNTLILKSHEEQVHGRLFPSEELDRYARHYRESYDNLYPDQAASPGRTSPVNPVPAPSPSLPPPDSSPVPSELPQAQSEGDEEGPPRSWPLTGEEEGALLQGPELLPLGPWPETDPQAVEIQAPGALDALLPPGSEQRGDAPSGEGEVAGTEPAAPRDCPTPTELEPEEEEEEEEEEEPPASPPAPEPPLPPCSPSGANPASLPDGPPLGPPAPDPQHSHYLALRSHLLGAQHPQPPRALFQPGANPPLPHPAPQALKRKLEVERPPVGGLGHGGSELTFGPGGEEHPRDKRLRTTIMPEQLDVLYRRYLCDSNPTRKALEQISTQVGLKKRVVQVWFQNTRARERKGQFRFVGGPPGAGAPPFPLGRYPSQSEAEAQLSPLYLLECVPGPSPEALAPEEWRRDPFACQAGRIALPPSPPSPPPSSAGGRHDWSEGEGSDAAGEGGPSDGGPGPGRPRGDLSESSSQADPASPCGYPPTGPPDAWLPLPAEPSDRQAPRRNRTQMSSLQLKVMKTCFQDYRTPTMLECQLLGDEIGLPKRVIQVWFQNARAKDKKFKLHNAKAASSGAPKGGCDLCGVKYGAYLAVRNHVFSLPHIAKMKELVRGQLRRDKKYFAQKAPAAPLLEEKEEAATPRAPFSSRPLAGQCPLNEPPPFGNLAFPGLPGLPPILLPGASGTPSGFTTLTAGEWLSIRSTYTWRTGAKLWAWKCGCVVGALGIWEAVFRLANILGS